MKIKTKKVIFDLIDQYKGSKKIEISSRNGGTEFALYVDGKMVDYIIKNIF